MRAFALEDMLLDLGCAVVGPALRVPDALRLAGSEQLDAAVLDVNIAGERSYPVAEELRQRGVPFVFATGYGKQGGELERIGAAIVAKPRGQEKIKVGAGPPAGENLEIADGHLPATLFSRGALARGRVHYDEAPRLLTREATRRPACNGCQGREQAGGPCSVLAN